MDRRFPIRTELTVIPGDDPNQKPIGFKCYNRNGVDLRRPNGAPIKERDELREGDEVLAATFWGDALAVVKKNEFGQLLAFSGHTRFLLFFEEEDLGELKARGWVCVGMVNTRALSRLDLKP